MSRTVNRQPISINYPSNKQTKNYFFNHYNWKGLNDDENFLEVDQETFSDAKNVYVDSEGLLRSRPALHEGNIFVYYNNSSSYEEIQQRLIDNWIYPEAIVYLLSDGTDSSGHNKYLLCFCQNNASGNLRIFATQSYLTTEIRFILSKRRIYVFASNSFSYYDLDTKTFASDGSDSIYVPVTKRYTASTVEDLEKANKLTTAEKYVYLYSKTLGVNPSIYGKTVSFNIDGEAYSTEFTSETNEVIVKKYSDIFINAKRGTGLNTVFDVAISSNNSIAMYSDTDRIVVLSADGKNFNSYVIPDGYGDVITSKDKRKINFSSDGNLVYIVTTTGVYVMSVYADTSTQIKKYPEFVNLFSLYGLSINLSDLSEDEGSGDKFCIDLVEDGIFACIITYYTGSVYNGTYICLVDDTQSPTVKTYNYPAQDPNIPAQFKYIDNNSYIRYFNNIAGDYTYTDSNNNTVNVSCDHCLMFISPGWDSVNNRYAHTMYFFRCDWTGNSLSIIQQYYINRERYGTPSYDEVGGDDYDTLLDGNIIYIGTVSTNVPSIPGNYVIRRMTFNVSDATFSSIIEPLGYPSDSACIAVQYLIASYHGDTGLSYQDANLGGVYFYSNNNDMILFWGGIYTLSTFTLTSFLTGPDGVYLLGVGKYPYNYIYYVHAYYDAPPGSLLPPPEYENVIYSSNISGNDYLELTYQASGNTVYMLPSHFTQLKNFYLSVENKVFVTEDVYENSVWQWYLPEGRDVDVNSSVTYLHPINDTSVAVFMQNEIGRIEYDTDAKAYSYSKTKLSVGLLEGSNVITSDDGTTTLFVTKRGLVALSYQDFVASTEQSITYLTDTIYERFRLFNISPIILHLHSFWLIAYAKGGKDCYIFDVRNKSWWYCDYPEHSIFKFITDNDHNLSYIGKNDTLNNVNYSKYSLLRDVEDLGSFLYKNNIVSSYYDSDAVGKQVIDWHITSQKLYLGAANYYKHIINVTLNTSYIHTTALAFIRKFFNNRYDTLESVVEAIHMNLQVCNYRQIREITNTENFSYTVDMIRTFVKRLNYFKVCEFQYTLSCDKDAVAQIPLSLADITVKYKLAGEVR